MPSAAERIRRDNEYVSAHIYALEDATVRRLFEAYRQALTRMRANVSDIFMEVQGDQWSVDDIAARNALQAQIMAEMRALDPELADLILEAMLDGHYGAAYGQAWVLDNSVLQGLATPAFVPLLPREAVRAQLLAPYRGQTFLERFQLNRAEFKLRVNRALVQSQIAGDGIYNVQQRIAAELGIDTTNWPRSYRARRERMTGRAHSRDFYKTQLIARSEILRASNLGAVAVYRANDHVLRGWEFRAARDERVCPRCGPLDGRQFDFDNRPIDGQRDTDEVLPPPIHPLCRCTATPALIDQELERAIVGPRETFMAWAERRGLTQSQYGRAYALPGQDAPQLELAS